MCLTDANDLLASPYVLRTSAAIFVRALRSLDIRLIAWSGSPAAFHLRKYLDGHTRYSGRTVCS